MSIRLVGDDDVVSVAVEDRDKPFGLQTFLVRELLYTLWSRTEGLRTSALIDSGIPCKCMAPGGGWQKGKIRLALSFIPDAPVVQQLPPSQESVESVEGVFFGSYHQ